MLTDTEGIDFNAYLRTVYISVRQNWSAIMPPSVQMGQQGVNSVEFRIMQDGKIPEDFVKLTARSGKEDLDRASLTAIRALAPFDHIPGEVFSTLHRSAYHFLLQYASHNRRPGRKIKEIYFRSQLTPPA